MTALAENAAKATAASWGPTGENTRALKVVTGLLVGGVSGQGASQLAANASAPYAAEAIGDYFTQPGHENHTAQLLSHAVLGGILAAANGTNATAGASAGASGELAAQVISKELYPQAYDSKGNFHPEKLDANQLNTVISLSSAVGALVSGVAGGTSMDANVGGNIAANAAENNWLGDRQQAAMTREMNAAKSNLDKLKIAGKYLAISSKQDVLTTTGIGMGLADAGWSDVKGLTQLLQDPISGLNGIKSLISDPQTRAALGETVVNSLNVKIDSMRSALTTGGDDAALQLGKDLGGLVWQVGTVVTGVDGAASAAAKLAKAGISVGAASLDTMQLAANLFKADAKGLGGIVDMTEVGMQFGKGIVGQGKPFEAFVQSKLPDGTLDLNSIKSNFSTFDHLTPDGMAVSTKTLDTSAVTYQNPSRITYQLNKYVDDMVDFTRDGKDSVGFELLNQNISAKQLQLGIPASASTSQLSAIAQSIQYAQSKGIQIIITKVK